MKNPIREQIEKATKKGAFDMQQGRVYIIKHENEWGKVHWMTGWYCAANLERKEIKQNLIELEK